MKWIHVALKWTSLWLRMGKLLHAGMALGKEGIFSLYKLKKGRGEKNNKGRENKVTNLNGMAL